VGCVAVPKVLLAVPLLVGGIYLPAAGGAPSAPPSGAIGMTNEGYDRAMVRIHRGQTITFDNDSHFIHIIGPGTGGLLAPPKNEPVSGRQLVQQNQTYTTGRWNTTGTYHMTCSVHPEMTIKIIVTP
jgi:plastocyanin